MVFSPSAAKSTTPRTDRPMRRWISTVRPSGRPRVASRCLRSPVDAGSIPYSAVTHPRPVPFSHFGTPGCQEAVQITRVSPIEMSADPVAVRTKSGSIVVGRRPSAARSWERLMRPPPAGRGARPPPRRQRDVLHVAQRQLQEARAEPAEGVDVAGAQEAVVALALDARVAE